MALKKKYADAPYFEAFDQNQGMAFYRVQLPAGEAGTLEYDRISDYSHVYLDGKLLAKTDRRKKREPIAVPAREKAGTLEIMVEAMGHVNFGGGMEDDRKGIVGKIRFNGKELKNWTIATKPLTEASVCETATKATAQDKSVPGGHFRGTFSVSKVGDTFFDMSGWGKGTLYVNGHNLGRYWRVGPQLRLFCPGTFLKSGKNTVDVVELELSEPQSIRGCKTRNFDMNDIKTKNLNNQWD